MKVLKFWSSLKEPYALYLVCRNQDVPLRAKIIAGATLAAVLGYVLSPLDILPDIHPVLGWLDDLLLAPLFIALGERLVPEAALAESRERAGKTIKKSTFAVLGIVAGAVLF